jgi:hypothetical protein
LDTAQGIIDNFLNETLTMLSYNSAVSTIRQIWRKNMDTQHEKHRKSTILYDAGGWFLIPMFFGGVFLGVVVDYFWNYLILYLALRWQKISITRKRRFVYIAIITAVGLLIDWLYYELTWGFLIIGSLRVPPVFEMWGTQPGLELSTILIPMALLWTVNYLASRFYLHLDKKQASVVGAVMAVFTAPWLIVAFVLLGW